MSILDNNIMIPKTLSDYKESRDKSLLMIRQAHKLLEKAEDEMKQLGDYLFPHDATRRENIDRITSEMDKRLWKISFDLTGFGKLMDAKAKAEFNNDLEKNPPEYTIENIQSIFLSTAQNADEMFARGLVNVLSGLSKSYVTNSKEPFKVDRKNILGYMVEQGWGDADLKVGYGCYTNGREKLGDIDRVIKILDGQEFIPRELESNVNNALKDSQVYEDKYYRIKGFKNRNMHIEFLREDLLDKANKVIGDYYDGQALAG